MIVPQFWAEAVVRAELAGRRVRVRRFGWSDASPAEAQANADARAADAVRRLLAGEPVARSEPKVPYNGAAGVPIREEVLARYGDSVVTRNSYGARCLNSPNVLFADVDFPGDVPSPAGCVIVVLALAAGSVVAWLGEAGTLAIILACVAAVFAVPTGTLVVYARRDKRRDPADAARGRLDRFLAGHPDWAVRVYRTPAGLRVLVTHQPFDPGDPTVLTFFRAIGTDPMYVRMCLNQQCFRARVTAKPWRVGIETRMRPRPGVWPVRPERLRERAEWVAAYEHAARAYAACEFVETLGSGIMHPAVGPVQKLHDDLCRATSGLPIG
jgi:hypothetical protein